MNAGHVTKWYVQYLLIKAIDSTKAGKRYKQNEKREIKHLLKKKWNPPFHENEKKYGDNKTPN